MFGHEKACCSIDRGQPNGDPASFCRVLRDPASGLFLIWSLFVGAIGGFITSGIIGLFVGSVVLVLGYKLVLAWLYEDEPQTPAEPGGVAP